MVEPLEGRALLSRLSWNTSGAVQVAGIQEGGRPRPFGHPGPIVNEKQLKRVDDIVQRSIAEGAHLLEGGSHEGLFYRPTVLTQVTTKSPAWTDEIFGPVAPITVVADDEEAIRLANGSSYGLVASIYTRSLGRGLAIADQLKTGMVHINDGTLNDEANIPFGGMGESGNGTRYGGDASLEIFTEWQWVTVRDEPPTFPF